MTKILEMYKCNICGNIVEIVASGYGELVCCGEPMEHLKEHTKEEEMLGEKHIPFVTKTDNGFDIKVGSIPHPMTDEHYIMFIETISEDKNHAQLQFLHPGDEPKMILQDKLGKTYAREFCNLHGLWEGNND